MFSRMVNPRRVLMVLASARKTLNPQDHAIIRNACPQIRQVGTLLQVFPPRNYCSVAEADVGEKNQLSKILKGKDWCHETEEKLDGISDISEDDVVDALKTLNPEKAQRFFRWYRKKPSYKPSSSVYNAMLRAVGKKNHFQKFWKLIEEMKEEGFGVEKHTFLLFCSRCRGDDSTEEIAKLFIWMVENAEEKPSASNCTRVLFSLATNKDPNMHTPYKVIEAYKNRGCSMNKSIYDSLQRCLSRARKFKEARKVMDTMSKEGFTPDNITYGQLIFGLCVAGKLEEACKVIAEMKEKGCDADLKTWTVLIEGHANADETDKALALFSDMVQSGCKAEFQVIQALVFHLCKKERAMDACNLVRKAVVELKIKPSQSTYVELIRELTKCSKVKEVCRIFDLMKEYNHVPDGYYPIVTSHIIHLLGNCGTVEDASSFISKLKKDGISGKACIAMVESFCKNNRHNEAQELASKLPANVANNPRIMDLLESASKWEEPAGKCPNANTPQDGEVIKKAKKVQDGEVIKKAKKVQKRRGEQGR